MLDSSEKWQANFRLKLRPLGSPDSWVLTEAAADVDVEFPQVVAVVHQIAGGQADQRRQVVLPAVAVEHVAGHLQPRGMHF